MKISLLPYGENWAPTDACSSWSLEKESNLRKEKGDRETNN